MSLQTLNSLLSLRLKFFTLISRADLLVHRRIVREIHSQIQPARRIDFDLLAAALSFEREPVTLSEAEEVAANLIRANMLTGYISYEERALMLTGSSPFPAPPWSY